MNIENKHIPTIEEFNIDLVSKNTIKKFWLKIISDGLGRPISVPLMVARGYKDGPTLGLTAAVHGNELNGVSVIQRLFNEIDTSELEGTVLGVPVVNIPSFHRKKRRFNDGVDLNHIMPGKAQGNVSQVYAYHFFQRFVKHIDFLMDLHTASAGRINSYYMRADMDSPVVRKMALLQDADIIVHNPPSDGTLRGAVHAMGIPALTIEVGNPNTFQKKLIKSGVVGIHNVLSMLKMTTDEVEESTRKTVICKRSYWIYTEAGGLLNVVVNLLDIVEKGQVIAVMRDVFGGMIQEYVAPERGIVIGKSTSPVNRTGGRILHLGIIQE